MNLAILSARIWTGEPGLPLAEAVLIDHDRITVVGSNDEVRNRCRADTTMFDLAGTLVTPGLVDGHLHLISFGQTLTMVRLGNLPSLKACLERIEKAALSRKPGEWVIGHGWNQHHWPEKSEPDRMDLDRIAPNNPVLMAKADGHTIWVNSEALRIAGITAQTPDPPGGRIERHPDNGEPNGLIREARRLIEKHMPVPTAEERGELGLIAQAEILRNGITGVHTCEGLHQWEALSDLEKQGRLKIRVHHLIQEFELEKAAARGIQAGQGSDRLWFGQAKLFADGSLGSGTALVHQPYLDDPTQYGLAILQPEELKERIIHAYGLGWGVAIHAIGDRAVTNSLEAIAGARAIVPGRRTDRIEHVQLIRHEDLDLFRNLDVVASVQPIFAPTDWRVAEKKWGRETCARGYIWKTLLETGIPVMFGSDAPADRLSPILGLRAALTRQDLDNQPPGGWFPDQGLTLDQALAAYTRQAARVSGREHLLGSIAPGKLADLTVFDRDLFSIPPQDLDSVEVKMTIVGGEVVYQKDG